MPAKLRFVLNIKCSHINPANFKICSYSLITVISLDTNYIMLDALLISIVATGYLYLYCYKASLSIANLIVNIQILYVAISQIRNLWFYDL